MSYLFDLKVPFYRSLLGFLLFCVFVGRAFATNTVVTNQLGQGVVFMHYHYDSLDGGKQEVYVTDINLNDPAVSINFPFLTAGRKVSAHAATVANAAVAVNGQFYVSTGTVQFLKVHGAIIYTNQPGAHNEQALMDDGFGHTNSISIALGSGAQTFWNSSTVSNIMACGPELIRNGVKITGYDTNDPTVTDANPRTCAAWTTNNHLLLECVDGRSTSSLGMTLPQLRDDVFTRGAIRNAFNLDGGGSTDMWGRGKGVMNVPSDGVERSVVDAVVIAAAVPAIPLAPTNLVLTPVNSTNALLKWSVASGAMTYNVKRSTTNGGPYTTIATPVDATYTDLTNPLGATFYYVVSAVNTLGQSSNSAQVSFATVPAAPTGLLATPSYQQIILTWSPTSGATGYNVKRSTSLTGTYAVIATTLTGSFTNTSLQNGMTYFYTVAARNALGAGPDSSAAFATPNCTGVPSAPLGLTATAANGQINLAWQAAAQTDGYIVKRATITGGPYNVLTNGLTTSFTDNNPTPGTIYYYIVNSTNGCGTSGASVEVSAPLLITVSTAVGPQVVMSGAGGIAGNQYYVLTSTDTTLPGSNWTRLATNVFGPSGRFSFSNQVNIAAPQQYFRIQAN